ncbi:hypothetical protein H0H87_011373 [Tephrocybe sp. NHM501043]|nr:hypothetical protein H0H87_011373 [Tephrocybe sp. NHM501043]
MSDGLIFVALRIVLAGLYINSFLAMYVTVNSNSTLQLKLTFLRLNARYYFQRSEGRVNVTLPHEGVYLYSNGDYASRIPSGNDTSNNVTINEAGLPLFKPSEVKQVTDIKLLEVKVTKERDEIHDGPLRASLSDQVVV